MRFYLAAIPATLSALCLAGCAATVPGIEQYGGMREVMREGQTEPRIALTAAVARPHAFAVGALARLAGEVTIIDGEVWVSRVADGDLRVTGSDAVEGDQAALLTLAHVEQWQSVAIESPVDGPELESLIRRTAGARGIDVTKPFPFLIEGDAAGIDLHVINGYCPIAVDPQTVEVKPWRWSSDRSPRMVIVGFFAPDSEGVMTHHGTSIHAHAVMSIDNKTITGHVDRVSVAAGMILRVPAAN